ncbi:MAG: ACP S-malonyltransferase [bacterium]|jgi:[acyl-carrier-protein] S-malonyltransferase
MSRLSVAVLFPGQGAQYVGMGKQLAKHYSVAREAFAAADEALGFSISDLCFNGPEEELIRTENTQPAIVAASLACFAVLKQEGICPSATAGLSLGEYAALVVAQSLDFDVALSLVHKRGRFMEEAVPTGEGTMAAILGLSREEVIAVCEEAQRRGGVVEPANYNCPGQVVIAGQTNVVDETSDMVVARGGKFRPLRVSGPFHSSLLAPAGERLAKVLAKVDVRPPSIPVVANVTGDYVTTGEEIKELLVRQVSSPVMWEDSILKLIADGIDVFIEVGPGKALNGFLKRIDRQVRSFNVEDVSSLEKTLAELKGVS